MAKKFNLKKMCTPATIYFVISMILLVLLGVTNLGDDEMLCVGNYRCHVGDKTMVFVINGLYILFWTFILDLMCKGGYSELSWFILLLPFVLSFLFLGLIILRSTSVL